MNVVTKVFEEHFEGRNAALKIWQYVPPECGYSPSTYCILFIYEINPMLSVF
jgi:hypothetical protein